MVVRELLTKLNFQVQDGSLKKYEKSTERAKQGANEAAASFRNMFMAFASLAAIRSISRTADSMQSLEARIGMLPQTVGDVGSAFNEVAKNATANRQSIEAYGAFYAKVGNAAKGLITNQEDLLKVTNTVSQALVVGGASSMEAESAMLQFGQSLASGVLQGDEFRSISEAAPQYLDELSKAMNIPRENLKKMASEGKLTAKAVIEATMKMSSTFEEKFKKMPMTVGQATTIMGNKWSTFIGNFNRETMVVTKVANFMVNAMDKVSNALESFVKAVGGGENALRLLMIGAGVFFAMWIPGWLASAAAVLAATWPILAIGAALVFVGLLFEDFLGWLDGADSLLGDAIGGVEHWRNEINNVKAAFNGLMSVVSVLWKYVLKPFLDAGFETFIASIKVIGMIFGGILKTVNFIVEGIKSMGNFIGNMDVAAAMQSPGAKVNPSTFGGFATGGGMQTNTQTINVTVPPGSPAATQEAARSGVASALGENPGFFAGQIGQAL